MSSRRRLLKNSGIYGMAQILQKAMGLVLLPVYTSLLLPEQKGIVDVVQPIANFLVIFCTLSINSAVVRYYVDYKDEPESLKEFWGACFTFVMVNSILLTSIFVLFKDVLLEPIANGISFFPYIALAMVSVLLNPVYTMYQSSLQARQLSASYGANNIAYFLVNVSLNIFFVVVVKIGAVGILLALAITDIIFFIYTLFKLRRLIKFNIKKTYVKIALKYSLPLLPHTLSGWAVSMIDRIFLGNLTGLASSAIYSTASQFGNVINVLTTAVNQAYVPWFFEKMKNKEENEHDIVKMSEILTLFYGVMAMGMSLFGPEIFKIMTAENYFNGWKVIPFLSFAFVFNGIYYFFVNPLFYNKRGVKFIAIGTFSGAFLNLILNVVFIPKLVEVGAALASLISMIASCVIVYFISRKIEKVNFNIIKLFSMTFILLGVSMLSFVLVDLSFWKSIFVKSIIVLIVFAIIAIIYRKSIIEVINGIKKKTSK